MHFGIESPPQSILGRTQGLRPSLTTARTWLYECMADHPECAQRLWEAPTRLHCIHSTKTEGFVSLVESHNTPKRYAALSHCWGMFQPLCTTKENYERHMKSIRLCDLPQTFQDAVTVVRYLGIEYLWIDSLCVI